MAKRRKIFSSYLVTFPNYSLRTFRKKCRVRSGQITKAGLLTTSQKFSITSELAFFTERFPLQVFITVPVCIICLSQNLYISDFRICISVTCRRPSLALCPASNVCIGFSCILCWWVGNCAQYFSESYFMARSRFVFWLGRNNKPAFGIVRKYIERLELNYSMVIFACFSFVITLLCICTLPEN